jgi:hypothetical protein
LIQFSDLGEPFYKIKVIHPDLVWILGGEKYAAGVARKEPAHGSPDISTRKTYKNFHFLMFLRL